MLLWWVLCVLCLACVSICTFVLASKASKLSGRVVCVVCLCFAGAAMLQSAETRGLVRAILIYGML